MTPKSPTTTRRLYSRIRASRRLLILVLAVFVLAGSVLFIGSSLSTPDTALAAAVPHSVGSPSVVVASLNIAMVTDVDSIVRELSAHPPLKDADVFLMQEVVESAGTSVAERVAARLQRSAVFASPEDIGGPPTFSGIAILSKTSISDKVIRTLPRQNLLFRSRKRIALAGSTETPIGRLRAVTAHLDTRINPGQRVRQLEPALEEARRTSPAILGGDLNTNDMEWVSNVVPVPFPGWQASHVRSLMESRGFHTPFTQRHPTFDHLGMQLDWIYTDSLRVVSYGIIPLQFSDHHAIWVQFSR